jgi:hypothetical protein
MQLVTAYNGEVPYEHVTPWANAQTETPALQVNNCNIQEYYILEYDAIISVGVHS